MSQNTTTNSDVQDVTVTVHRTFSGSFSRSVDAFVGHYAFGGTVDGTTHLGEQDGFDCNPAFDTDTLSDEDVLCTAFENNEPALLGVDEDVFQTLKQAAQIELFGRATRISFPETCEAFNVDDHTTAVADLSLDIGDGDPVIVKTFPDTDSEPAPNAASGSIHTLGMGFNGFTALCEELSWAALNNSITRHIPNETAPEFRDASVIDVYYPVAWIKLDGGLYE